VHHHLTGLLYCSEIVSQQDSGLHLLSNIRKNKCTISGKL